VALGALSGWYHAGRGIQISGVYRARTGGAITPVAAGLDLNGDGNLGDRTPTLGRNSFRISGTSSTDIRGTWAVPIRNGSRVMLYAEVFNLFDQENISSVNNDYGSVPGAPKTTWMQPLAWFAPREVQLGARITF
jgi:hypothetical protein